MLADDLFGRYKLILASYCRYCDEPDIPANWCIVLQGGNFNCLRLLIMAVVLMRGFVSELHHGERNRLGCTKDYQHKLSIGRGGKSR